jgi:DNA polymerase/3'-5' exonuclease PolX
MPAKPKWPRSAAVAVAKELCDRLAPYCTQLKVAGSLRRGKAEVGDVEIVFVPRMEERQADFFATAKEDLAAEEIERMLADGTLTKRPSKTGVIAWGGKNKLAIHRSGVPVDLFATTPESFWNYLVCRTGPSDLNVRIAGAARTRSHRWNPYGSGFTDLLTGEIKPVSSEEDVFAFVGIPYQPPTSRK